MKEKTIISHQNDGLTFLEIRSEEQFINNVQSLKEKKLLFLQYEYR